MSSHELSALAFLLGHVALLAIAIKLLGLRRLLIVLLGILVVAVVVAFKTLGAVTGARRY
jgi:hypothetical protein